jgi:hypothetical protein
MKKSSGLHRSAGHSYGKIAGIRSNFGHFGSP